MSGDEDDRAGGDDGSRAAREQQLIFERAQMGIVCSRNRVIQRCNPRFEEMFGYAPGEVVGMPTRVYYGSDESWEDVGDRAYADIIRHGVFDSVECYARKDGVPIWCHVTGTMLDPQKPEEGFVWFYEDITERRATEQALKSTLREFALIFDNALIGISYQRNRVIQRCNRRLEQLFGYPPGALIGQSTRVLYATDREWEDAAKHYTTGESLPAYEYDGVMRFRKLDGTAIWVHIVGRTVDEPGVGKPWIWTWEDVSAQRDAEDALRSSNQQLEIRVAERTAELSQQVFFLQQLIEAIPGSIFYKDAQGRYLGCNSAFADFLGVQAADLVGRTVSDTAPPDLAQGYVTADQALLEHPGAQVYESPVRRADGEMRQMVFHKATFTRPDGAVGGLVGFMLDITERKRMEERLQQAATVFDSSAEGVIITSPQGQIIAVNRAFTEITGYGEEEAVGRHPRFLQSGLHDKTFYRRMWETIEKKGRWQGEIWDCCKDGRIYPESLTISAVKDAGGAVTHYVGVFSDITALKQAYEQLDYLAHHDPLTGLANRRLLEERLAVALDRAARTDRGIAVLFIDLDRFKNINDTLGHQAGDLVLREVAERLRKHESVSDTITRVGGDEFLAVVEDLDAPAAASQIASRILGDLSRNSVMLDQEFFVGASIGISLFPQDGRDSATLIQYADMAMYRAKERGRNTYEFFSRDSSAFSLDSLQIETELRRAIERDELRVFMQPKFSLHSGALVGAEALVRWQHPKQGLMQPGQFIHIAEDTGLIVGLDEWIRGAACRYWAEWDRLGRRPGVLSVNVSGIEFRRGGITETVRKVLDFTGLAPRLLELEITESAVMSHPEGSVAVLDELRAMGVVVAIDDFGTGYSSLSYLKRIPLDKLKLDQSFVRGLPSDADDCAIARAIIALGHSLQLSVIAEGVESQDQLDFLAQEGCDEMQGYLRGHPVPAEEFAERFLASGQP